MKIFKVIFLLLSSFCSRFFVDWGKTKIHPYLSLSDWISINWLKLDLPHDVLSSNPLAYIIYVNHNLTRIWCSDIDFFHMFTLWNKRTYSLCHVMLSHNRLNQWIHTNEISWAFQAWHSKIISSCLFLHVTFHDTSWLFFIMHKI